MLHATMLSMQKKKTIQKLTWVYRVTMVVWDLGCVDSDLQSSPGCQAATVATYCPGRMEEHPKSKSTGGFSHSDGPPCRFNQRLLFVTVTELFCLTLLGSCLVRFACISVHFWTGWSGKVWFGGKQADVAEDRQSRHSSFRQSNDLAIYKGIYLYYLFSLSHKHIIT